MGVQFILGASGTGKSDYLNRLTAKEAYENQNTNYIMLVPEQFSSELQQQMIKIHEKHGFMNIDIIGFNRLAYRVFEEKNVKVAKVLEDFGKSMLIRRVAGELKDKLKVYGNCIDKNGFIDETKSLFSELFTYNISAEDIEKVINTMDTEDVLCLKLNDMLLIYNSFIEKIEQNYIIAEKEMELLARYINESEIIKNSVISLDGFTGFTPVQLKLLKEIFIYAKDIRIAVTIDKESYFSKNVYEHDLYYLSSQTIKNLNKIISETNVNVKKEIIFERNMESGRFAKSKELYHLEKSIFRYPVNTYNGDETGDICIWECRTPRDELKCIAEEIKKNAEAGLRYRDMAVVTGDLEQMSLYAEKVFAEYHIPVFIDNNRQMTNNPFIDSIYQLVNIIDCDYDFESVFSFLKSQIISDISEDMIEKLENYVLAYGIRGHKSWSKKTVFKDEDAEKARQIFLEITEPVYKGFKKKDAVLSDYVKVLREFAEKLDFEGKISEAVEMFNESDKLAWAGAYKNLYKKLIELFDKMDAIMPDEKVKIHDFLEILTVGMGEIKMGIIPPAQDMVVVGDINRTRLGNIKILLLANVNEGIIPKHGNPARIINDDEKERLKSAGINLAPTDKVNSYIEQFYLYLIMTKPTEKLILSYSVLGNGNESKRPAYIIDRVCSVFPKLMILNKSITLGCGTYESDVMFLTEEMRRLMEEEILDTEDVKKAAVLFNLYKDKYGQEFYKIIEEALTYDNSAGKLSEKAREAIKGRLLAQSVSRLERYAGCAYEYFIQYGLSINERRENTVDVRNIGNIIHLALKDTFNIIKKEYKNDWSGISSEQAEKIMDERILNACEQEKEDLISLGGQTKFLVDSIRDVGKQTVKTLKYQISKGKMNPFYIEKAFSGLAGIRNAMIAAEGEKIPIKGIIDRVDLNITDEDVYVKLIDYKTGNKDFKIEDVYEGLSLQLVVYMNVLMEMIAKDFPGKKVIPAGMYYYHIDKPFIEGKEDEISDEEIEKAVNKALRLRGVSNIDLNVMEMQEENISDLDSGTVIPVDIKKDGFKAGTVVANEEQFAKLCSFGNEKMEQLTKEILAGNIEKNPVSVDRFKECDLCKFREICRFDPVNTKNKYRRLNYSTADKKRVWQEIVGEKEGENSDGTVE